MKSIDIESLKLSNLHIFELYLAFTFYRSCGLRNSPKPSAGKTGTSPTRATYLATHPLKESNVSITSLNKLLVVVNSDRVS